MKKIFCLLLTLSLLCMGVALADTEITTDGGTGSTTVTYTVPEPGTGYTVVIPASVAIPQGETSTTMQISVGAGSTLESGKTLSVKLESSANNFSLKLTGGSRNLTPSQVVDVMRYPNWHGGRKQQADILTSELDSYRMLLNGVIRRIAGIWLLSRGIREEPEITWEEINLQDQVEAARGRLYDAQAKNLTGQARSRR